MVSEEDFFKKFSIISPWELMTPWGVANLDPRGIVGRIYVGHHQTLLYTKFISCGPHNFREDFFSIISLWELMTLGP